VVARWTPDRIIAALQRDARRRGRPPKFTEWERRDQRGRRPTAATVQAALGSWNKALMAAGLECRGPGDRANAARVLHANDRRKLERLARRRAELDASTRQLVRELRERELLHIRRA
jgi:Homing endonuclease associated repeat